MNKEDVLDIADKIEQAIIFGQHRADEIGDGGSANLDSLVLRIPGMRIDSLKAAGVNCYKLGSDIVVSCGYGQGMKQTVGVEAAAELLRAFGHNAFVRYQMD